MNKLRRLRTLEALDLKWLMAAYILLVTFDLTITYIGVTHFGMTEGSRIINYYGIELGVVLVLLLSLVIADVLWKLRKISLFRKAVVLAFWMLCLVELAAVINNLSLMF